MAAATLRMAPSSLLADIVHVRAPQMLHASASRTVLRNPLHPRRLGDRLASFRLLRIPAYAGAYKA